MSAVSAVPVRPFDRKLPPVVIVAMVGLTMAITGGVLVVAQIGQKPSLAVPTGFMVGAIALELAAIGMLVTIRPFAWDRFFLVLGWALLAYEPLGDNLIVFSLNQHDTQLMAGAQPLLPLDVWEHAYYLNYQNRRPDYIKAFWNVVNWEEVASRYDEKKNA